MNASMPGAEGNARFHNRLLNWSAHFISTALLICLLVLAGWKFNISIFKSPLTHGGLMNPVTALSLSLLAIATLLLYYRRSHNWIRRATGHCLLLFVMGISTLKLLNSTGIVSVQVDYWLFYPAMQAEILAGKHCHMTPVTVACLFLISLALWLLPVKTRSGWVPAQPIALMVIAITFFSFLSHLYYIQAFYGIFDYIPMPLYSAIAFTLLALSVFSATAGHGLMDIFSGTHAGTMMARFVVPAVIIVPALFGLLRLYGHWRGIFTTEFGVAILVLSIIIFFLALTWYTARLLNTRDTEKEITTADLLQTRAKTQYQAQLLQNISDAVISTDVDFKIVSWNKAAEELYGWREEEVLGKTIGDLLKPVYEKESREEILSAYFKNNYWKGEVFHHTRKGDRLSILVSTTVMKQDNVNTGTVAVIRDITQRKRAEKNFRDLLDAAPDATVIVDARGKIQMVNKRVEEIFQYAREELLFQPVEILMPINLKQAHVKHMQQYVAEPRVRPMGAGMELQARRKDDTLFPVEISLSPLETEQGLLVSAAIRDISERRAIEQRLMKFNEALEQQVNARTTEIRQINEQLRQLSARLEEAQEQERIRIAREIHDELGQQLTGLKMDVAWLSKKTNSLDEAIRNKFVGLLSLLDQMVVTVRRISTELRPAVLDDLGLMAAIEWHSAEFEKRFHIKVLLFLPPDDVTMPQEKATGIFRVYQEALTNIARHANAASVKTTIRINDGWLLMTIADDGRGFDQQQAQAKKTLGLIGMKERIAIIGGRYNITGNTEKGTVVSVEVPL